MLSAALLSLCTRYPVDPVWNSLCSSCILPVPLDFPHNAPAQSVTGHSASVRTLYAVFIHKSLIFESFAGQSGLFLYKEMMTRPSFNQLVPRSFIMDACRRSPSVSYRRHLQSNHMVQSVTLTSLSRCVISNSIIYYFHVFKRNNVFLGNVLSCGIVLSNKCRSV